jgi:uncharacterized membrane protein YphA (DoxX/SURF4 family)
MQADSPTGGVSKKAVWVGWILTILPALMLIMSGVMKLLQPPEVIEGFTKMGWDSSLAVGLAIVELGCTILYLVPRTSVLGAVLLTGYLGGATATHVRIGDSFLIPIVLGIVIWGALYLREERLRWLLPLRR